MEKKCIITKKGMLIMKLEGHTYREIAVKAGVSVPRVQQLLSPPRAVRNIVYKRANGKCQSCGILVRGRSGHIHHAGNHNEEEDYNDVDNLQLLCPSCHKTAHLPPTQAYDQKRCPDCMSAHVWSRGLSPIRPETPRYRYVCVDCGCTFYVWSR